MGLFKDNETNNWKPTGRRQTKWLFYERGRESELGTRAPNDDFWKISVRKTIWDLEFSEHLL